MKLRPALFATFALLSLRLEVVAGVHPGAYSRYPIGEKAYPAAPRIAEQSGLPSITVLAAAHDAIPSEVEALRRWNSEGRVPYRNGLTRLLVEPLVVNISAEMPAAQAMSTGGGIVQNSGNGKVVWTGAVLIEGAHRVRLHLTELVLPPGATLWVYGPGQSPIAFDAELAYNGSLYAPSVESDTVILEVEAPLSGRNRVSFSIRDVLEIFPADKSRAGMPTPLDSPTCLVDAMCVSASTSPAIDALRRSVAHLEFVKDGQGAVCSGGLINADLTPEFEPYLLTANHCFSTQAAASSLEVYWDYRASSCGGTSPPLPIPHRGATILATGEASDFTFVRLNSLPGGRWLLGWDATGVGIGTTLHRVSHPWPDQFLLPAAQRYSTSTVQSLSVGCSGAPPADYLYSRGVVGGTYPGSSGAPVTYVADGHPYIVGQLLGKCGPGATEGCDNSASNFQVDGRLSSSYAALRQFLDQAPSSCTACTPSATTACLLGNRFKVTMNWKDYSANLTGTGSVIRYADNLPEVSSTYGPMSESAFFSMYLSAPKSIETLVRMIKGATINNKYWVFLTGFAGAEYTVNIQDTQTCGTWTRTVASGATNMTKDFDAFPFP